MNLKEFNLERALAGDPVVTRDGRKVTQLHRLDVQGGQPIRAVVNGAVLSFHDDGRWTSKNCQYDLMMLPKTIVVWLNFYDVGNKITLIVGDAHSSEEAANAKASAGRIGGKAVRVDIEA